jgi:hypothetical protein
MVACIPGCATLCKWSRNLSAEVLGYQGSERPRYGVPQEVQVTDCLRDNAQLLAGGEILYQSAEDLTKGHVSEVERDPVGDGCAAGVRSGGGGSREIEIE